MIWQKQPLYKKTNCVTYDYTKMFFLFLLRGLLFLTEEKRLKIPAHLGSQFCMWDPVFSELEPYFDSASSLLPSCPFSLSPHTKSSGKSLSRSQLLIYPDSHVSLRMISFGPCSWCCPQVPAALKGQDQGKIPALPQYPPATSGRSGLGSELSGRRNRNLKRGLITKRAWKHLNK